ncbi:hypothetical protein PF005_g8050 [Phytophthora fragariae]|uniref:DUF7769 domain-containing protein n=3 Tax=Phytophthora fragariae TaxID=53985 RepID=A0A6A3RHW4_9STRA|nr:hypothetical protein PF003_g29335 [Phytophthora fragariae]KAE8945152.1 hypothetical protein PF009_g5191 [Phytophthora fragariae]KAE9024018.1 hypothetical protein PF011_g3707 [Phytophthora fragariae]KAE9094361.1 hypothetical protein PF007_g17789 [Phytophthora fragariae]KAE9097431.1 hypothetical protein PF010_g15963 [Phytophthora fragariae]
METPAPARKTNLTDAERHQVLTELLQQSINGVLQRGTLAAVATVQGIHPSTVSRLWTRAKKEFAETGCFVAPSLKRHKGRHASDHTHTLERLRGVDVAARSTVRSAAAACGMAPTTLFRQLQQGRLRSHTSVVKPILSDANKAERLQFSLSHIQRDTMLYDKMLDTVHVDEKLFYITQPTRRFLLLPGEEAPIRRLRSKRYITKVMFLAAVGRPRFDPATQQFFDGKLGIWPFVEHVPAQRSSARRPAGTIITKDISVTKTSYRAMLIAKLLPALCEHWPEDTDGRPIVVQQDNAPAHIASEDQVFADAVAACGRRVVLRNQPPNNPDLNCNDLGLFASIQARQQKKNARTTDELIAAVTESYWELPMRTINATFLSLQGSMDDCIAQDGDNNYKPRHMKKAKLEREGRLPMSIRCCSRAEEILTQAAVL